MSKTALVKTGLDAAALRFKPDLPWGVVFADAMLKIYTSHQLGYLCFDWWLKAFSQRTGQAWHTY